MFKPRLLIGLSLLCTLVIIVLFSKQQQTLQQHAATNSATVTIDLSHPIGTSQFVTGASHTQNDSTLGTNQTVVMSAKQVISQALDNENVPIMGWGSPDPEPSPGTFNWSILDKRMQFMRSTGTTKMITLCCAPGWMRDSAQANDWQFLDARPTTAHFKDFANLAKQVALRYPDVQYFQVWNELKGFYNSSLNRWDYESYTQFYNEVYDAIKSVRPDAKIGGPYVVINTWAAPSAGGFPTTDPTLNRQAWGTIDQRSLDVISYWIANKHGADFLVIDGHTGTREGLWPTDEFAAANYFTAVINWIRKQPGGATLPIGWAEWYPNASQNWNDINHYNALLAHDLITTLKSGVWYALLWGTQGDAQGLNAHPASFMTSSGQPTTEYATLKSIKDNFGPGTQLYQTTSSTDTLTVLASKTKTMLVNHLGNSQTVTVNGSIITLNPYQVTTIDTPGSQSLSTHFALTICPHGLGNCGDNSNPAFGGNFLLKHITRNVLLTFYDSTNKPVTTVPGSIMYNSSSKNFQGTLSSSTLATGQYTVILTMNGYLGKQFPGIIGITQGQTITLPEISLITGDINNDNQLNILDYNAIISCFGLKAATNVCTNPITAQNPGADLNDDGVIDGIDYNLFIREISVQPGSG